MLLRAFLGSGLALVATAAVADAPSSEGWEDGFLDHAMTCLSTQQSRPPDEGLLLASGYASVEPPEGFGEKVRIYKQAHSDHVITVDLATSSCSVTWRLGQLERDELFIGTLAEKLMDRASKNEAARYVAGDQKRGDGRLYYGFLSGRATATLIADLEGERATVTFSAMNIDNLQDMLPKGSR